MPTPRQLIWCGPVFEPTGYADEGREMLRALEAAGVPVALRPVQKSVEGFAASLSRETRETLECQAARVPQRGFVLAQHFPADGFAPSGASAYNVGRTMFETDGLPQQWVSRCNAMDELWIPSQFNIDAFARAGVMTPMYKVPGGIDSDMFRPAAPALAIPGARGTVFLAVFEWRQRKGWDVLLRAWSEAFMPDDDVTLVLRASRDTVSVDAAIDAFLHAGCGGRARRDVARIVLLPITLAPDAMPSLYTAAHAYVSPTRGEGWGRPFMEAMACGLPVLATRWSAQLEYMHDANSLLIDVADIVPASDPDASVYNGQHWAEPSAAHLARLLQRVHADRGEARAIGERARRDMVEHWPWSRTADAIVERLRAIDPPVVLRSVVRDPTRDAVHGALPPRFVLEASVFGASASSFALDRVVASVALQVSARSAAHEAQSASVIETSVADPIRPPSWSDAAPAWNHVRTLTDATRVSRERGDGREVTITWLDMNSAGPVVRPAHGQWIVVTGDVVSDSVPGHLVRALRDAADEVWVPGESARAACLEAGVAAHRIWTVPFGNIADCCTPTGARLHVAAGDGVHATGAPLFLLLALTESAAVHATMVLRVWQRVMSGAHARIAVVLPEVTGAGVHTWQDAWCASTARLFPAPHDVSFLSLPLDAAEMPALLRAASVVIDPGLAPSGIALWQAALACGRPVVTLRHADSEALLAGAGGVLVEPGSSRGMSGTGLTQALLALCDPAERSTRGIQARAHAMTLPSWSDMATQLSRRCERLTCAADQRETREEALMRLVRASSPFALDSVRDLVILAQPDWHDGSAHRTVARFAEVFPSSARVSLALCFDPAQGLSVGEVEGRVHAALRSVRRTPDTAPDIVLVPDAIDDSLRASLIMAADIVIAENDAPLAAAALAAGKGVLVSPAASSLQTLASTLLATASGPVAVVT